MPEVASVGLGADADGGGYVVRVRLRRGADVPVPAHVGGVPVEVVADGAIVARSDAPVPGRRRPGRGLLPTS